MTRTCEHDPVPRMLFNRFLLEAYCSKCGITLSSLSKQELFRNPQALADWCGRTGVDQEAAEQVLHR